MKSVILLIALLFSGFISPAISLADSAKKQVVVAQWEKGGLRFSIDQVAIGNFSSLSTSQPTNAMNLAVTVEFFNGTSDRKIDLNKNFNFQLLDEFSNTYRQLPDLSPNESQGIPENLKASSVYPDGIYRQTIYFETPVSKSKSLVLRIHADNIGLSTPIDLNISKQQIRNLQPKIPARVPQEEDLKLIAPISGTVVSPGAVVHIGLQFPTDVGSPSGVYIISPNYVFEDYGGKYQYDVRIPKNQPQGPYVVVVMTRWGQKDDTVLSKTITLEVGEKARHSINAAKDNYID